MKTTKKVTLDCIRLHTSGRTLKIQNDTAPLGGNRLVSISIANPPTGNEKDRTSEIIPEELADGRYFERDSEEKIILEKLRHYHERAI